MQGIDQPVVDEQAASPADAQAVADAQAKLGLALASLGSTLKKKFDSYSTKRNDFEKRWLANLRAFNNKYDPNTIAKIKKKKGSQIYIGLTRKYTEGFSARLAGAAMPTETDNWGFEPTPIPEAADLTSDKTVVGQTPEGNQLQARDAATGTIEAYREKSKKMTTKVKDQLAECDWPAAQREGIDHASIYGMMVVEGPIVQTKTRVRYKSQDVVDPTKKTTVKMMMPVEESNTVAVNETVSPWDFYWDTRVKDAKDLEDWIRRFPCNAKKAREFLNQEGAIPEQVALIIAGVRKQSSQANSSSGWESELRTINGISNTEMADYEILKYIGPVGKAQLEDCGCDEEELKVDSPIACVWFCNGIVFKVDTNYLLSDQPLNVSVFSPFPDGISMCGFGVPELAMDPQAAVNGCGRMIMDHGAAAAVPIRIINKSLVKALGGNYSAGPGSTFVNAEDGFMGDITKGIVNVETRIQLQMFFEAFNLFYRLMDDVTQLPQLAVGAESRNQITAREATIQTNNSNEVLRRILKRYEDGIVDPTMTRMYHYNMQYSDDESIKGDFNTVTRGVEALQEAEAQGQWYEKMLQWVFNPQTGVWFKKRKFLEGAVKAQRISADDVLNTQEEADAELQKMQAANPQHADPRIEVAKMQGALKEKELAMQDAQKQRELVSADKDRQLKNDLAELEAELEMAALRINDNQFMTDIKARMADMRMKIDNDNKKVNLQVQAEHPLRL